MDKYPRSGPSDPHPERPERRCVTRQGAFYFDTHRSRTYLLAATAIPVVERIRDIERWPPKLLHDYPR